MALPIKDTPVLKGKYASAFLASVKNTPVASKEEKERIEANYNEISKLASF